MSFAHPQIFWALPIALFLFVWAWRRKEHSVGFSSLTLLAGFEESTRLRWRRLPEVLTALAVGLLIIACAGPQVSTSRETATQRGVAIELLVDISSSMDMSIEGPDKSMTRLEAVKEVLQKFILGDGEKVSGRPNDLLGLITFARYADTACPLTSASDALADIVSHLEVEDRPNEDGTAYGDAVSLAAARLKNMGKSSDASGWGAKVKSRVIVLLTDGENNCGRHLPLEAAALAKAWGIRIYVISLGGDLFSETYVQGGKKFVLDAGPSEGEQILERMANETGGIFRSVDDIDSLHAVYEEIDTLEKSEIETEGYRSFDPLFWPFASGGLLALCLGLTLSATVLRSVT